MLNQENQLPWVADIFQPGLPGHEAYDQMTSARQRLYEKMGVQEDPDVEKRIDALLKYAETLSLEMFRNGRTYQKMQSYENIR